MLYAVVMLRGIKLLRAKNSISDMPRTWNLHNFSFNRFVSVFFMFFRLYSLFIGFFISLYIYLLYI